MPTHYPENSVGLIVPSTAHFADPLQLSCGEVLPTFDLIYETYGTLNPDASNAILICHALSGDHHAAGFHSAEDKKPGWWDTMIGPGKPLDTKQFFIVSCNNIGGCAGSTGPTAINPGSGKCYGPDFPIVTVQDWVSSQSRLADLLGIHRWLAIVGGSLGGMQALQWTIDFPDRVAHALIIAAAPKLTAQNIAFNEVARQAIRTDPDYHDGWYSEHNTLPARGLRLARMLGHITYLSDDIMAQKFGRDLRQGKVNFDFSVDFQVESYLRYQADSFVGRFDANTYLLMTKSLDYFDPAANHNGNLTLAVAAATASFLVISFSSDWRFAAGRSREIVKALHDNHLNVSYANITSSNGHDAFLMQNPQYFGIVQAYMDQAASRA
ncbi:MAG TPA: homoserine O-acetyltransferase [Gammaproteobacteria bacterium]|nr:homoserine O-acetyltransferase [Gammaproteobacteria bacterium]